MLSDYKKIFNKSSLFTELMINVPLMPHIKPVFAFQGLSIGLKEKRKRKLDIESKLHTSKKFQNKIQ